MFYSPDYPYGTARFWPLPQAGQWELHLICKAPISGALAATDEIVLPPEYQDAIMWNLALRLAPSYGSALGAGIVEQIRPMAFAALATLRIANAAVPSLALPNALTRRQYAGYPWVLAGLY